MPCRDKQAPAPQRERALLVKLLNQQQPPLLQQAARKSQQAAAFAAKSGEAAKADATPSVARPTMIEAMRFMFVSFDG